MWIDYFKAPSQYLGGNSATALYDGITDPDGNRRVCFYTPVYNVIPGPCFYGAFTWGVFFNFIAPSVGTYSTRTSTDSGLAFQEKTWKLLPYELLEYSGSGQWTSLASTTALPLRALLRDPKGAPSAKSGDVIFRLGLQPKGGTALLQSGVDAPTSGPLTVKTENGFADAYLVLGRRGAGTYTITAEAPWAPGTVLTYTIVASDAADPVSSSSNKEKSLGGGSPCGTGASAHTENPINIATGNKFRAEEDYGGAGPFPLRMVRYYNSMASQSSHQGSMGTNWRGYYDRSLAFETKKVKGGAVTTVVVSRADGSVLRFTYSGDLGRWVSDPDVTLRLASAGSGYTVTCDDDVVEDYDASGRLQSISARGRTFTQYLTYNAAGNLERVTDAFGRALGFTYDASHRIASMSDPAGAVFQYSYDGIGNLERVTYPDLSTRTYGYGDGRFPSALTSVTNENGTQWVSYTYDSVGRAVSSQVTGGGKLVTLAYLLDGSRAVGNGNGTGSIRRYGFAVIHGVPRRTSVDNGACASCGKASVVTGYSPQGHVSSITDMRGVVTEFVRDPVRGLELSRTEALGQAEARTITTTWHPTYRVPLTTTEPGQTTTYTYDSAGRTTGHTVADTSSGASRTWAYSYDARGLLATVDGPRTDVSDISTQTYDANGNLATVTNALGHITTFTAYDRHGRPLSMTGANGVVTTWAYDSRGRVLSVNVGGQLTENRYYPTGHLRRVTRPDGTWLDYNYDEAMRLTGMTDNVGNRVVYTLDSEGNRTSVQHLGVGGLAYLHRYHYDEQNRLDREDDALNRIVRRYAYDPNGNRLTDTDAAGNVATGIYDSLNRVVRRTDGAGGVTNYGYDARDNLVSVTDPVGMVTTYTYDGLDDLRVETSANRGTNTFAYDSAGNLRTRTWANGRSVTRSYDQNGRLQAYSGRSIAYDLDGRIVATGSSNTFGYDGADRLASQSHAGQGISYTYDANGNRRSKTVGGATTTYTYAGNTLQSVSGAESGSPSHDASGNLVADGSASFVYDARNRLAGVPGASYAYDGNGLRVHKLSSAQGSRHFAHGLGREVLGEYDDTGAIYETVYLGSTPVAVLRQGQPYWIDADQVDTPRTVRSATDAVVWRWDSEAFGSTPAQEDPSGLGAFEFNLRFPGQVFDRETGLHHNDQRDYAPRIGRYVQSDPIGLAGGMQTFSYAAGNPVSLVDPTGELPIVVPLARIGAAYLRCIANCAGTESVIEFVTNKLDPNCVDITGITKDCAKECLNPINWVKGPSSSAARAGTTSAAEATKKAPVIIGESMKDRVIPKASEIDGHFYKPRGEWTIEKQERWARDMKREIDRGQRDLVDIGLDPERGVRSTAYEIERRIFYGK